MCAQTSFFEEDALGGTCTEVPQRVSREKVDQGLEESLGRLTKDLGFEATDPQGVSRTPREARTLSISHPAWNLPQTEAKARRQSYTRADQQAPNDLPQRIRQNDGPQSQHQPTPIRLQVENKL